MLERANTVASGLGSVSVSCIQESNSEEDDPHDTILYHASSEGVSKLNRRRNKSKRKGSDAAPPTPDSTGTTPTRFTRFGSGGRRKVDSGDESPKFRNFCRGSIKRLRNAESKVTHAKRDMEEILASAKVRSRSHLTEKVYFEQLRVAIRNIG